MGAMSGEHVFFPDQTPREGKQGVVDIIEHQERHDKQRRVGVVEQGADNGEGRKDKAQEGAADIPHEEAGRWKIKKQKTQRPRYDGVADDVDKCTALAVT